jgi:hypothetical protein
MKVSPQLKPAAYGAICGAAVLALVGFTWGGWLTGRAAERRAMERADTAVVAALTPICVAKFKQGGDAVVQFAALKKLSSWEQGAYVEKGGWATMNGSTKPNSDVARACADSLSKESRSWFQRL